MSFLILWNFSSLLISFHHTIFCRAFATTGCDKEKTLIIFLEIKIVRETNILFYIQNNILEYRIIFNLFFAMDESRLYWIKLEKFEVIFEFYEADHPGAKFGAIYHLQVIKYWSRVGVFPLRLRQVNQKSPARSIFIFQRQPTLFVLKRRNENARV